MDRNILSRIIRVVPVPFSAERPLWLRPDVPANSLIIVELDKRIHPVKNHCLEFWNASRSKRPIREHPLQASFQIDSLLNRIPLKTFRTDVTLQKLR